MPQAASGHGERQGEAIGTVNHPQGRAGMVRLGMACKPARFPAPGSRARQAEEGEIRLKYRHILPARQR